jgi:hypothetical protein
MFPFLLLLTLFVIIASGITTIPFSIGLLAVSAVLFKKSRVFFLAFGLGLFLDLIMIRLLGYTSLVLTIFVFILFLYERKFETQTVAFVFISTFLGSFSYLWLFGYQMVFWQALVNALITILAFRLIQNSTKSITQLTH